MDPKNLLTAVSSGTAFLLKDSNQKWQLPSLFSSWSCPLVWCKLNCWNGSTKNEDLRWSPGVVCTITEWLVDTSCTLRMVIYVGTQDLSMAMAVTMGGSLLRQGIEPTTSTSSVHEMVNTILTSGFSKYGTRTMVGLLLKMVNVGLLGGTPILRNPHVYIYIHTHI